ncbi:MAG: VWA domain-containing protein [Candidatus Kapaibacterium sp.]|nr:MAG: VWA domain-containing protein [Candidatus Kapabacteria bacterium]
MNNPESTLHQRSQQHSRLGRLLMRCCAPLLLLSLTACPHHLEKMIDSAAPPKGYKPTYSTSEVSFGKLKDQAAKKSSAPQSSQSKDSSGSQRGNAPTESEEFNPDILTSFPYTTAATAQGAAQSSPQGMMRDSNIVPGMGTGMRTGTLAGMNLDSLAANLPQNMPTSGINLDSLQRRIALDSTLLSGRLSQEEVAQRVAALTKSLGKETTTMPSPESITKSSSASKNANKSADKNTGKNTDKNSGKNTPSDAAERAKAATDGMTEKLTEQGRELASGAMEQAFALAAVYRAKADAFAKERAARERAEAEAYKRIAEEEERAAKKLAAKPAIMPIMVDIRSIRTERYPQEVELQISVLDTAGRFITGLAPPYFQGTGNYRAYWRALTDSSLHTPDLNSARVRSFEVQEVREAAQDTHAIAFVLDHSPSMGSTRALRLQEAVARTLGIVKRQDFISVVKFTKDIKIEVPLTNDTLAYRRGFLLDGLEGYGGGTALYDGAMAGIEELKKAPQAATKIVVLFSDGGDNSSKNTLRNVYQAAKREGVRIYSISYGMFDDIDKMRDLATYTGGKLYQLYSAREFPFAFGDVYKSLKNYYRVRYKPVEAASQHAVQLRLAVPELVSVSTATAEYDRSIFTPLDSIGSVQPVNIEFETGKATIRAASMEQVRDFAAYIKRFPKMVVEIRGHTDDKGSDDINQKLSEARAEAVRTVLIQFGVQATQLRTKGFGKSQPLVPNDSDENRRKNRRTEFAIVAKF